MQELTGYFRCPEEFVDLRRPENLSGDSGYFCFGPDTICYGRSSAGFRARRVSHHLYDVKDDVRFHNAGAVLPFDPAEVVSNLRYERYVDGSASVLTRFWRNAIRQAYYLARPLMSVSIRKHLQKIHLQGWQNLAFPRWPVDTSVDALLEELMALAIRCRGGERMPFIWFWPEGSNACALMTHDVEEAAGIDLCSKLMDMNESFGIPASFQIVPEKRYSVAQKFLDDMRSRGFEVNVHDLDHDGRHDQDQQAGDQGNDRLQQRDVEFEYEMSVPNVARLEPQRGGCCTVMPYFVGKILELPVTTTQDYSLFHVLNTYSLSLWEQQIDIILQKHGMVSVIIHPDYITGPREEETYRGLLGLYYRLRRDHNVWVALPRQVNTWWRQRSQMRLVQRAGQWSIEGPGSERAAVAFASLENDQLTYSIQQPSGEVTKQSVAPYAAAGGG